jgi:hypothetical protein
MEDQHSRPAPSPEPESDDSSSLLNPRPSEGDRLAFEPVPLRYRDDGLTPERQRAYVEALADTGIVREAAARVGISEQAINRVRRRFDAHDFDRACEAAHRFGARRLRSIAFERAVEGTLKGHYYHGELVSQERVYDNRLLIYLLGKTEHLLDPPEETQAICDNWEPYMDALEHGLPPPELDRPDPVDEAGDYEAEDPPVWCDGGTWWTFFPPPEGFDGEEEGELGDEEYQRRLTGEEEAAIEARNREAEEAELARCCATRDRYFGLPERGTREFFQSVGSRNNETSEPAGPEDPGPIEYKSLLPPRPIGGPRGIEPRRGGAPPHPNRPPPASLERNHREQ